MKRLGWYAWATALGGLIGGVLGALGGEGLARLVLTPGPQFNEDGDRVGFMSVTEYLHRLDAAGDWGMWIGAMIGAAIAIMWFYEARRRS